MSAASEREEVPYTVHRQLFGWVISHDPARLYMDIGKPSLLGLPDSVTDFVRNSPKSLIPALLKHDSKWQYVGQAENSLHTSLIDVVGLFCLAIQSPDMRLRDAVLSQSGDYVNAIANFAKLPTDELATYFHVQNRRLQEGRLDFRRFQDDAYSLVQIEEDEIDIAWGCPFAKPKEYPNHRDLLFDNFVHWGTRISVCAINAGEVESLNPDIATDSEMIKMMAAVLFSAGSDIGESQRYIDI